MVNLKIKHSVGSRKTKCLLLNFSICILCVFFLHSCEDALITIDVDCSQCYYPKPDSADLVISLTYNKDFKKIPITVFRGDIESMDVEYVDTVSSSIYYLFVPVDKEYSVRAEYNFSDGRKVFAVDGTKIKTKRVIEECGDECWIIRDDGINVELKYTDF